MLVGLWRADKCGQASLVANLLRPNADRFDFAFVVATDPTAVSSTKHPYRSGGRGATTNVTHSILTQLPKASLVMATSEQLKASVASPPFAHVTRQADNVYFARLQHAVEATAPLLRSRIVAATVVLRPDAVLTRPLPLDLLLAKRGLFVILGYYVRRCVFAARDWDFGFVAVPPVALDAWVAKPQPPRHNGEGAAAHPQPPLPDGFGGVWRPTPDSSTTTFKYCGTDAAVSRADTAELEQKIGSLAELGSPLRALHEAGAAHRDTFLALVPPKACDDALAADPRRGSGPVCLARELLTVAANATDDGSTAFRHCRIAHLQSRMREESEKGLEKGRDDNHGFYGMSQFLYGANAHTAHTSTTLPRRTQHPQVRELIEHRLIREPASRAGIDGDARGGRWHISEGA